MTRPTVRPDPFALRAQLFAEGQTVYAVVDGAGCPDLLPRLRKFQPEHVCLYRGDLDPEVEEVAPWLVRLEPEHPFVDWYLEAGWGNAWGVFIRGPQNMAAVRGRLRRLLIVKLPDGRIVYFRFYDPRVMRVYFPTCTGTEAAYLLNGLEAFLAEDSERGGLHFYMLRESSAVSGFLPVPMIQTRFDAVGPED